MTVIATGSTAVFCAFAQMEMVEDDTLKLPDTKSTNPSVIKAAQDPLKFFATSMTSPPGKLAYLAVIPPGENGPPRVPFNLIIRQNQGVQRSNPAALYRATPDVANVVFDPQYSPNAQYILLKAGWPYDRRGVYKIYLWNLKAKTLQPGPEEMLSWRRVHWSPDGNYLAYVRGGDAEGFESEGQIAPLRLYIYSLVTGKSRIVAQNRGVTAMAWTRQNTLLYTVWPKTMQDPANLVPPVPNGGTERQNDHKKTHRLLPSIYEIPAAGENGKEIVKDVYGPVHPLTKLNVTIPAPSPDGKWIAFLGLTDDRQSRQPHQDLTVVEPPEQDVIEFEKTAIFLYNRTDQKRVFVGLFSSKTEDFMRWTGDSKHLIAMETTYAHGKGEARFSILDINTLTSKELTVLRAQDIEMIERPRAQPQFEIMQTSKNGKWLFVKVSEAIERHDMFYTFSVSLQAIDITTGTVSLVARIENFENNSPGMDWLDESVRP